MATFTIRSYRGHAQDAEAVMAFLTEISLHPAYVSEYQIGDFVWRAYKAPESTSTDEIALCHDSQGRVAAIGWFDPPRECEMTIHPALHGTTAEAEMIVQISSWAEERYAGQTEPQDKPLRLTVNADDVAAQRVLSERGYHYSGEILYASNFRTLEGPLAAPELPGGYEIVAMTDDADLVDRVEIHRDVWAPSKFTLAGYQSLRRAPVYRQDLDLAVRAPDGRYASYLIAWWDPAAKSGLLEPVGARAEYRRLGLTRALIQEALIRLRDLGATRCYVNSEANEVPSNALYRSAGFRRIVDLQWWTKQEQSQPKTSPKP
jgi:mycothiol synthase